MSVFGVRSMVTSMLHDWQKCHELAERGYKSGPKQMQRWCTPPEGWVKVNTGTACQIQTGKIGVAWVIRDD